MLEILFVLENKLELMEKTHGEFLEFINLKKYNNLSYLNLNNLGKHFKE